MHFTLPTRVGMIPVTVTQILIRNREIPAFFVQETLILVSPCGPWVVLLAVATPLCGQQRAPPNGANTKFDAPSSRQACAPR